MYRDRTLVRDHLIKLRLSDRENEMIDQLVQQTGGQKAALIRELLMKEAAEVMAEASHRIAA
jgi:predicted DNA-binding protein